MFVFVFGFAFVVVQGGIDKQKSQVAACSPVTGDGTQSVTSGDGTQSQVAATVWRWPGISSSSTVWRWTTLIAVFSAVHCIVCIAVCSCLVFFIFDWRFIAAFKCGYAHSSMSFV